MAQGPAGAALPVFAPFRPGVCSAPAQDWDSIADEFGQMNEAALKCDRVDEASGFLQLHALGSWPEAPFPGGN